MERKSGVILNIGSMSGQFGFRAGKGSGFHMTFKLKLAEFWVTLGLFF